MNDNEKIQANQAKVQPSADRDLLAPEIEYHNEIHCPVSEEVYTMFVSLLLPYYSITQQNAVSAKVYP